MGRMLVLVMAAAVLLSLVRMEALYADGGYFSSREIYQEQTVESDAMGAQQAFLLKTDDAFTLYLQSSVKGDMEDFSWVLPLPAVPDKVAEAPEDLFRLLDDLTSPRIVQYEVVQHGSSEDNGCLFGSSSTSADGGGGQEVLLEDGSRVMVEVLDAGRVGDFSYEIVGTQVDEALAVWLDQNDYRVPDELQEMVSDYVEEGFVFLAAKVLRDLEPDQTPNSLPPLAITFPINTDMVFPMRLTALSTETTVPVMVYSAAKDLPILNNTSLWMEVKAPSSDVCTVDEYEAKLQQALHADPQNLALQFRERFNAGDSWSFDEYDDDGLFYRYSREIGRMVSYENYDVDSVRLLREMILEGYTLVRWYGQPTGEAMKEDIRLKTRAEQDYEVWTSPEIIIEATQCSGEEEGADEGGGCAQVPDSFILLLAVLMALLAVRRLRPVM